jgi:DNA-directed RNA polymerase sigma subunit (sigma70/sigma32)
MSGGLTPCHNEDNLTVAKEDVQRVLRAARRVEKLSGELERARADLRQAVTLAHERGETVSGLARKLGVTRQRVYQLLE